MFYLFVIWLGDRPIEKVFTSLRIVLWSNVLRKLLDAQENRFLMMFNVDENRSFIELIQQLKLMNDDEQYFVDISPHDQQKTIEDHLKNSKFITYDDDDDQRLMVNIEHVDNDYLLKSSKESSVRILDDNHLFDRLFTFGKILEKCNDETQIIHICDFQSQYQTELFVILSKLVFHNHAHLKQCFLALAPAVVGDDRPLTKYDEFSVDNYIKEVLSNVVNERATASPMIAKAIFKLQLMCRKANSIVHLRSNLETNHDTLFLLYMGARLVSILNNYNEKHQKGCYPGRETFNNKLEDILTSKDEQEFIKWIDSFEARFLMINFANGNKIQINLDRIYQEFILFCRRLSPYYSKVRILTENQVHLLPIMFARLALIERIVVLLRRILSFIGIPLIERM